VPGNLLDRVAVGTPTLVRYLVIILGSWLVGLIIGVVFWLGCVTPQGKKVGRQMVAVAVGLVLLILLAMGILYLLGLFDVISRQSS